MCFTKQNYANYLVKGLVQQFTYKYATIWRIYLYSYYIECKILGLRIVSGRDCTLVISRKKSLINMWVFLYNDLKNHILTVKAL